MVGLVEAEQLGGIRRDGAVDAIKAAAPAPLRSKNNASLLCSDTGHAIWLRSVLETRALTIMGTNSTPLFKLPALPVSEPQLYHQSTVRALMSVATFVSWYPQPVPRLARAPAWPLRPVPAGPLGAPAQLAPPVQRAARARGLASTQRHSSASLA